MTTITTMPTTPALIHPRHLARILSRAGLYQLSASALQVLCDLVASGESQPLAVLARNQGLSSAAMTNIADNLCAAGIATRQPSRTDRRVTWLQLTERGRTIAADILNA